MSSAPPPSSFDHDPEFFEEKRWQKLSRRLKEEPLIPLGCFLTCWALYGATRSMRAGDSQAVNRYFRRRIYAQGFTVAAMFVGSVYWQTDRQKRKEFDDVVKERKAKEKRDAWLRELEVRDEEERAIRRRVEARRKREHDRIVQESKKAEKAGTEGVSESEDGKGANTEGSVTQAVKDLTQGR